MRNVTLTGKILAIVSQLFRLPVAIMRRMITKLINKALLATFSIEKMASDVAAAERSRRKLVVGLGNPGMIGSRHSVGMAVITALAERLGVADQWRADRRVSGDVIVSVYQDTQLVLLRPKLLMNVNGVSVVKTASRFSVQPEHIVLVHDELDKPLGKLGIKNGGSARGHNGVRSCVDCLQSDVMPRLRIGIGRPSGKTSVDRHVLGRFSKEEQDILSMVLEQSVDLLLTHLTASQLQISPPGGRRATHRSKERTPLVQEAIEGQTQK